MNIKLDFDNPSARLPLAIVLDTSASMEWDNPKPIDLLNEALQNFKEEIENDEVALMSVELALINCGSEVKVLKDFDNIYNMDIPHLNASGGTPLGEAVELAINTLEERKNIYKKSGIQYYQPMLLIMSDGYATDSTNTAVNRVLNLANSNKLSIVNLAIGSEADVNLLKEFHPKKEVTKINKWELKNFFRWLSESVKVVSNNNTDENIKSYNDWIKN